MQYADVIELNGRRAVQLPDGFHLETGTMRIRREGVAVILEPVPATSWPAGFFDAVRIDDPSFERPPQGETPPAPELE